MILDRRLEEYIQKFNNEDEEVYKQEIDNEHALGWLKDNVPLFECPDPVIEEIYYFRWWTYRKHIKKIPEGYLITEFLPEVPWSGKYNSINCAAGFHIREGRWLRNGQQIMEDTIRFWLQGSGDIRSYSTWIADALWDYCCVLDDYSLGTELLDSLTDNFEGWIKEHGTETGLFWSIDDRDAMEFSISGSGFRPTLNSYLYADARAISQFAEKAGRKSLAEEYAERAENIKKQMQKTLWSGDFFQVIPAEIDPKPGRFLNCKTLDFEKIPMEHNVRELIGYIPWYFNLPDPGYEKAFAYLMDEKHFLGKYGFCTADQAHPRYKYQVPHECLWNGPVWPFATSQALVAMANLLRNYHQEIVTEKDYHRALKIYAESQHRITESGKKIPWIDEDSDPETGEWISREILKKDGWKAEKGGYERGKDYNHSMYCDLIITGLLGLDPQQISLAVKPMIPPEWDYVLLEGVRVGKKEYTVLYDRDGTRYGKGKGLMIY